jgi:hypothetical protein
MTCAITGQKDKKTELSRERHRIGLLSKPSLFEELIRPPIAFCPRSSAKIIFNNNDHKERTRYSKTYIQINATIQQDFLFHYLS